MNARKGRARVAPGADTASDRRPNAPDGAHFQHRPGAGDVQLAARLAEHQVDRFEALLTRRGTAAQTALCPAKPAVSGGQS